MGFFNVQRVDPKTMKARSCATCGLYKHSETPKLGITGNGKKGILILGDSSSETEDKKGQHWTDLTGRKFGKQLEKLGIDLFEDCWSLNAVGCIPIGDDGLRPPTSTEISCCRKRVKKAIKELDPHFIIALGINALESLIGDRWKKGMGSIDQWRGWRIPDRYLETRICPMFHPWYVAKSNKEGKDQVQTIFINDLKNALEILEWPIYQVVENEEKHITLLRTPEAVNTELTKINRIRDEILSFDYETTGLKPHLGRHQVICMSIAVLPSECYSFPIFDQNIPLIQRFLKSPQIAKSAFNMKFENNWSAEIFKARVRGWKWDAMLAAHVIDNRPSIKSLKHQAYLNFGVMGYDEKINPYLKAKDKKNANAYNSIQEFIRKYGINQVLIYCGLDSIYENMLGRKQRIAMGFEKLGYEL